MKATNDTLKQDVQAIRLTKLWRYWSGLVLMAMGIFALSMDITYRTYTLGSIALWLSSIGMGIYITLNARRITSAYKAIKANPALKRSMEKKYWTFLAVVVLLCVLSFVLKKSGVVPEEADRSVSLFFPVGVMLFSIYTMREAIKKAEKQQ